MDREIIYPAAIVTDSFLMQTQKDAMIAAGYGLQALAGTASSFAGLPCTQTGSLSVSIGAGLVTSYGSIDTITGGEIAPDSGALLKYGISSAAYPITFTATSGGNAINYLIEAQMREADGTPIVIPFYNSAAPTLPFNGPANSGGTSNTRRTQSVAFQQVTGTAATLGSQVTPAADSGWIPLWVVTVTSSIVSIVNAPGAPLITGQGGKILRTSVFASVGTYAYVPSAGTSFCRITACGGGSAGAAAAATDSTHLSTGGGGASGSYWKGNILGLKSATLVVGSGGAASTTAASGTSSAASGTATIIYPDSGGSIIVPAGVYFASTTGLSSASFFGGVGYAGGAPVTSGLAGGTVFPFASANGQPGQFGLALGNQPSISANGGNGASSPITGNGGGQGVGNGVVVGTPGTGPGAGGGGSSNGISSSAQPGGNGAPGWIRVDDYS